MKTIFYLSILIALYSCKSNVSSIMNDKSFNPQTGIYLSENFVLKNDTLPYRILFPKNFSAEKKYPVLFFLHGSGERGNDNEKQLTHGGQLFLDSSAKYPAIIVFPQCPKNGYWASIKDRVSNNKLDSDFDFIENIPPTPAMVLLENLIDTIANKNFIDQSKVHIAGLSMGGMGTGQLLANRPDFFASGTVICGAAPLQYADQLQQTPTSIYHGDADPVVSVKYGEDYFNAIDDGTSKHRIKIYKGVDHTSWNNAFAEPDFLSWIFSHKKKL